MNHKLQPMKNLFYLLASALLFFPLIAGAQVQEMQQTSDQATFRGKVIEVIEEREIVENGSTFTQQNVKVEIVEGDRNGQILFIQSISDVIVTNQNVYKKGDHVLVYFVKDASGSEEYYIVDYVRTNVLAFLLLLFIITVIAVLGRKGIRPLISLFITAAMLLYFVVPNIISGRPPVLIASLGALIIMTSAIFITEGWSKKTKVTFITVLISLILLVGLSWSFTLLARLTGIFSEDAFYVMRALNGEINMQGLLLAGIIIGTLGVVDDVILTQVSTVYQLAKTNRNLGRKELFAKSMEVGRDHIKALVNTLFLAYM